MKTGNSRHIAIVTVLTLISTFLVYVVLSGRFIGWGFFEWPETASTQAVTINQLMEGHFILIGFLFSIIVVPSIYAFVVFRRKEGDDTDAPHIHGNTAIEIAWTVLPMLLVIGFGIWGLDAYDSVLAQQPNEQVVRAQGFKWDWNFYYPEMDNMVAQSLVVEVNRPVRVEMQSRDVLHAFWVPEFRVKQDLVPYNISNTALDFANAEYSPETAAAEGYTPQVIRFTPTMVGVFRLRCAEICGTNHYAMLANVFVLDAANYKAWRDGTLVLPTDPNQTNAQPGDFYFLDELQKFSSETGIPLH